MKRVVPVALLVAGCSNSAWMVSAGVPPPVAPASVAVESAAGLATVMGVALFAGAVYELSTHGLDYGSSSRKPPEMDPERKVSEQDCTKPLDFTRGNIRCK